MKYALMIFLFFVSAHGLAEDCAIEPVEKNRFLEMNFDFFDQSEVGWRSVARRGCPLAARDLIDSYLKSKNGLLPWQIRTLTWHGGQLSAFQNLIEDAISRLERTYNPEEPSDASFLWNPYVSATVAFLKKDRPSLLEARHRLSFGNSPYNHINLRTVDSFIRCFKASYQAVYSKTCLPKESNVERIQSMAIELEDSVQMPIGLTEYLLSQKLLLVGEVHGNEESPKVFGQIVKSFSLSKQKLLVALELPDIIQSDVDNFLRTRDDKYLLGNSFFNRKYQDGRSSRAMVKLLRELSKMPEVTVVCMDDTNGGNDQTRDTGMAQNIYHEAQKGYDRILVYAGNVHSSLLIGTSWNKKFRPMGYELNSLLGFSKKEVLNIRLRYGQLNSWMCMGRENICKEYSQEPIKSDYSEAVNWDKYYMNEDGYADGYKATVFIRKTTASRPFK